MPLQSRAGTLAVEISLDPRVWVVDDAFERIDFHMAVYYHPHTIAGAEDRVQIMRDHDNGQLQLLLQIKDQLVEFGDRFAERYERLLLATGSLPTEQAVNSTLGYDLTEPAFWNRSLDVVERRVEQFLELANRPIAR